MSVALPPGKQCMIAGWFVWSLILWVMESSMTRVFNLSELMVGGFGNSDPVTGRGEIWESSYSYSLLSGENRSNVSTGWMSDTCWACQQHFFPGSRRKLSGCWDCGDKHYYLFLLVGKDTVSSFPTLKMPLPNDCIWSRARNSAILGHKAIVLLYIISTTTATRRHIVTCFFCLKWFLQTNGR